MGEAPPAFSAAVPRRAAAAATGHCFRLPRRGRRKVLVIRLGGGGGGCSARTGGGGGGGGGGGRGPSPRRLRLRWLRRAAWRLAELCVAALSGPLGVPDAPPPPWRGVESYFAAPFLPAVLMRRAGKDH
ncbi:hypothetical protein GUJ93_ZPchr0014g46741 [Zizania palustris]|uniref:Uncharacterized protein n=1 Tax=Zizania palustris TaxID=103762 RepID=A0A8J5T7W1_ZIZPA|nr:hypothetical protein GUJ93_ZPchr0014g46741 [Zizania palustris]